MQTSVLNPQHVFLISLVKKTIFKISPYSVISMRKLLLTDTDAELAVENAKLSATFSLNNRQVYLGTLRDIIIETPGEQGV